MPKREVFRLNKIDEAFKKAVSESIEAVLGTSGEKILYSILKRDYGVSKDDVAENPELLVKAIEKLLGPAGQDLLVRLVSEQLTKDLRLKEGFGSKSIPEILNQARRKFFNES
jgi:hypothetical protein